MPEKKETVKIIPVLPGTANPLNFMYNAYTISIKENIKEKTPKNIPTYSGAKE